MAVGIKTVWTDAMRQFVVDKINVLTNVQLGKHFGLSSSTVREFCMREGITRLCRVNRMVKKRNYIYQDCHEVGGKHMLYLKNNECSFIMGDARKAMCCGDKKHVGSYCKKHAAVCYEKPPQRLQESKHHG